MSPKNAPSDDKGRVQLIERAGEVLHGDLLPNPCFVVPSVELERMVPAGRIHHFDTQVFTSPQSADSVEGVLYRNIQVLRGMEDEVAAVRWRNWSVGGRSSSHQRPDKSRSLFHRRSPACSYGIRGIFDDPDQPAKPRLTGRATESGRSI